MSMQTYLASTKRPSDLTDYDLLQQAQIGDPSAFEILVERYSALLYFLISGMVRDEHLAHDVLQRVFLQRPILFSEIELFPDGGEYAYLTSLPDPDRQPEEQAELHELRELLLEAIEALPSRYRAVVLLRYGTQLSYREIARALSIPETTAKTYFSRARKQLRSLLGSEFAYD